ncbi:hypothetical protein [Serratia sp. 2723]|uniref:hypothetical protein n=1 Tax=unclassified Serratia (in: enterobacteria) TaxID=2647522 RepID=UPI003D1BBF00
MNFSQLSMPGLNSSHSVTKDFNTKLENGVMDKKTAQITFNSPNQIIGKNLLRTIGSATGLGIKKQYHLWYSVDTDWSGRRQ